MKSTIALIGFPGSGKTTVSRLLAEQLGWPLVDSDQALIEAEQMPIAEIFARLGEAHFRQLETQWLLHFFQQAQPVVLSTGGGLPCFGNNLALLQAYTYTVWLKTSFETVYQRLLAGPSHTLLQGRSAEQVAAIFDARRVFYQQATLTVDAEAAPWQVAEQILKGYRLWVSEAQ